MINYTVNSNELREFCEKCDTLCSSKLILADKKISNLLKSIASSEDMCIFIKDCLEGFNYKIEFLKSKQPIEGNNDKFVLVLPQEKDLVAYVFCLLCEFENKDRDLTEFLIEYYDFNELFADGFSNFCSKVLIPFKNTVISLCGAETEEAEPIPPIQPISAEIKSKKLSREQYGKICKLCQELCRNITKEAQLSANEREEYCLVAEAFYKACAQSEEDNAQVFFVALKHMCKAYRFLNNKVRQIEKLFNDGK